MNTIGVVVLLFLGMGCLTGFVFVFSENWERASMAFIMSILSLTSCLLILYFRSLDDSTLQIIIISTTVIVLIMGLIDLIVAQVGRGSIVALEFLMVCISVVIPSLLGIILSGIGIFIVIIIFAAIFGDANNPANNPK